MKQRGRHLAMALNEVAPCSGAWIETNRLIGDSQVATVAPCSGAWIETSATLEIDWHATSLLARERGLNLSTSGHVLSEHQALLDRFGKKNVDRHLAGPHLKSYM